MGVWVNSRKIGCAVQQCSSLGSLRDAQFLVCEYSPPGNYQGQFPENVLPLSSFAALSSDDVSAVAPQGVDGPAEAFEEVPSLPSVVGQSLGVSNTSGKANLRGSH